jgi:hypothetical protein
LIRLWCSDPVLRDGNLFPDKQDWNKLGIFPYYAKSDCKRLET